MLILQLLLAAATFLSPVRYEVLLAGNFGEPRPNHFHAGLDIKTDQMEGKPIHAIGDGFVCRVTVSETGTGNCLYVRHPNGYTSVYAHLQRFSPVIEALVKRQQYRNHSCDVDLKLRATDCPVREGQVIALSGDTGASEAPHLHLEIRRTDNWNVIDPLEMIPELLCDTLPPVAEAFMAFPVKGKGVFCGKGEKSRYDFVGDSIPDRLTAWGKVGFGIYANDFMQGSHNRCGVRYTRLLVDSVEVFSSDVNNIASRDHIMVNVWGDYDYYDKNGVWFLKSFIDPNNRLPILKADKNRGIVNFCEERDYKITYELSDFFGNKSIYHFIVTATKNPDDSLEMNKSEAPDSLLLEARKDGHIRLEGAEMDIPEGVLLADVTVAPLVRTPRRALSAVCRFSDVALPMEGMANIRLRYNGMPADTAKLYIAEQVRHHDRFVKAQWRDGWMVAEVPSLHNAFRIDADDSPPQLRIMPPAPADSIPIITVAITETKSGLAKVTAFIDDEFILLERVNKTNRMFCNLTKTPVMPNGGQRQLTVEATDNCGNITRETVLIDY